MSISSNFFITVFGITVLGNGMVAKQGASVVIKYNVLRSVE